MMEKQPRRENRQEQSHRFFDREPLYQYIPVSQQEPGKTCPSIDDVRSVLTKIMWPRLVVLRIHHVLSASLPLMNLTHTGTCGIILDDVMCVVSPLGWMLHGIRLLINVVALLQHLLDVWMTEDKPYWGEVYTNTALKIRGTQFGNDLLWIIGATASSSLSSTAALLGLDMLWLASRLWIEITRLYLHADSSTVGEEIVLEEKKFFLNLLNLMSISAIAIIKNFVLPTYMPLLAVNPVLLFMFSLLSLAVTIICHLVGQSLEQKDTSSLNVGIQAVHQRGRQLHAVSFFKKPASLDNTETNQEIGTACV